MRVPWRRLLAARGRALCVGRQDADALQQSCLPGGGVQAAAIAQVGSQARRPRGSGAGAKTAYDKTQGEGAGGMSVVTARLEAGVVPMHKCVGECGALVRDEGYCTRCEQRVVMYEARRMELERQRRQSVAPEVCEASEFGCLLTGMPLRERVIAAGILIGALGVTVGMGALLFLGAQQAVSLLLRWSA